MFLNFKKRMLFTCLGCLSICYLIISIVCIKTISSYVLSNYQSLLTNHINSLCNELESNIDLAEQTALLVTENSTLTLGLSNHFFDSTIIDYLNGLKTSSDSIQGISIYITNREAPLYTTTSVSNAPTLTDLKQNIYFEAFSQTLTPTWVVRSKELFPFYDQTKYERSRGILTYLVPITDPHKNLLGFLIMDLSLPRLFELFKVDTNQFLSQINLSVTLDDHSTISSRSLGFFSGPFKHNFTYTYLLSSNAQLYINVSLDSIYKHFSELHKIAFMLFFIIFILFIGLTKIIIKQFIKPLESLSIKMNHFIDAL